MDAIIDNTMNFKGVTIPGLKEIISHKVKYNIDMKKLISTNNLICCIKFILSRVR